MEDDGFGRTVRRKILSRRAAVVVAMAFLFAQDFRFSAGSSQFLSSLMYAGDSSTIHRNVVSDNNISSLPDQFNASGGITLAANQSSSLASGLIPVPRNQTADEERKEEDEKTENYTENKAPDIADHPHQGARDAGGRLGYITDVTKVRRRMIARYHNETGDQGYPPTSWFPRDTLETHKVCDELPYSSEAILAMAGHWDVDAPNPDPWPSDVLNTSSFTPAYTRRTEEYERYNSTGGISSSKILCAVYTHAAKHEHIQVLIETWGWRCDGFFAASTATIEDPTTPGYGAVNLTHQGAESYRNMWQKTRSILGYMHDNYLDMYEYFYVCGDDTVLIVENLRRFLFNIEDRFDSKNEPLYLGEIITRSSFRFAGGGPGYLINVRTLRDFFARSPNCFGNVEASAEDRFFGRCMHDLTIPLQDTADARGRQRFLGYVLPEEMTRNKTKPFQRQVMSQMKKDHVSPLRYSSKVAHHHYPIPQPFTRAGMEYSSKQVVALHWFKKPLEMLGLGAFIYKHCPSNTTVGNLVRSTNLVA